MTELELNLPELNPAQHKWLQGYIAQQRIEELTAVLHNAPMPSLSYEQVEDRIATLKRKAEGK